MSNRSQIILKRKKDHSLLRKHPWVFSGAIHSPTDHLEEGSVVDVVNSEGLFLGTGHFQIGSISVRVFEYDQLADLDQAYWNERFARIVELRRTLGFIDNNETTIFRLCHAEGDGMPGLVIDMYHGTAIIQCHSIGMWLIREQIVEALKINLGDQLLAVYDKSAETLPYKADIEPENGYLHGEDNAIKKGFEYGIEFAIDWETGQKTGFFIDQRENRALLGKFSKDKKVLNTFCYSGGFSMYALKAGATEVHSLDSSKKAIELVEQNLQLLDSSLHAKHKSIVADAVKYIRDLGDTFDVIVLDPPAFAKHVKARHKAIQAYKRLNRRAMEQLQPGGILFTFSCSQVVTKDLFNGAILAAAIEANREVKILHQLHQPADHPINIYHPESEYLKGLVVQVN
ncbi:class I SAM-dependent rRNA methyltransferase [Parvicella tangerina]|uniref:Ribosomal RNA large subunit methyltransferase I n=1 Tax=Parvicella tangerina TaxID=2829795 RepID=A0A916JMF3_9FLAO|nr:class I SAM-dependent rRNA methyltransferase [Parvicella tangerina]CAG5081613.1 Ribosomal RNA large subunit methyltransferase I [Parvicella tangerina]